MMTVTKDFVTQRIKRGGGVDVTGMGGNDATIAIEIANKMLQRNTVNSSILYDRAKLSQLVKSLSGLVKDGKIDQKRVLWVIFGGMS